MAASSPLPDVAHALRQRAQHVDLALAVAQLAQHRERRPVPFDGRVGLARGQPRIALADQDLGLGRRLVPLLAQRQGVAVAVGRAARLAEARSPPAPAPAAGRAPSPCRRSPAPAPAPGRNAAPPPRSRPARPRRRPAGATTISSRPLSPTCRSRTRAQRSFSTAEGDRPTSV